MKIYFPKISENKISGYCTRYFFGNLKIYFSKTSYEYLGKSRKSWSRPFLRPSKRIFFEAVRFWSKIALFRLRTKPDMSAIRNDAFYVQKSHCFDYVPSQTCQQFETMRFVSENHPVSITYQARHVSNSKRCVFGLKTHCLDIFLYTQNITIWSENRSFFNWLSVFSRTGPPRDVKQFRVKNRTFSTDFRFFHGRARLGAWSNFGSKMINFQLTFHFGQLLSASVKLRFFFRRRDQDFPTFPKYP